MNDEEHTLHKIHLVLGLSWQVVGRHQVTELCDRTESEAAPRGYGVLQALVYRQTESDTMPTPHGCME